MYDIVGKGYQVGVFDLEIIENNIWGGGRLF